MSKTTAPAARVLRTRKLAEASRAMKSIKEAVAGHDEALAAGTIPDGSFLATVQKYFAALEAVKLIDQALAGDGLEPEEDTEPDPSLVQVNRDDLQSLVAFAHAFITPEGRQPGGPVDRLATAAGMNGAADAAPVEVRSEPEA